MVVVAKKDGSPRHTIDLQRLSEATYRATYHTSYPFNLPSSIPPEKKTSLDAIIFSLSQKKPVMQQLSSMSEDVTDIAMDHKAAKPQETPIQRLTMT